MAWLQVLVDSGVLGRPPGKPLQMRLRSLDSIMAELGHSWLTVLKIDVEGSEWGALAGLLAREGPLPFTQLQVGCFKALS